MWLVEVFSVPLQFGLFVVEFSSFALVRDKHTSSFLSPSLGIMSSVVLLEVGDVWKVFPKVIVLGNLGIPTCTGIPYQLSLDYPRQ